MTSTSAIVHIPALLRSQTQGVATVEVTSGTVHQVFDELEKRYPMLVRAVRTESNAVRPHVNVFVNQEDIRRLRGLQTPVEPGDALFILPSVSGG